MKTTGERVTLKKVALHAGVGRSTVGLILSGRGDELGIPKSTQTRVRDIAHNLNYRPNSLALGLVGKHTQTIGLLLPSGPFFPQFLMPQELSHRLHRKGYQTYLADSLQDHKMILGSMSEMASRRVNGIVFQAKYNRFLTPPVREILNQFRVSILITEEPIEHDDLQSHVICCNMRPAIRQLVDHFVSVRRRRPMIVTIVGPSNSGKIEMFKQALRHHGLDSTDEAAVFDVPKNSTHGADYYRSFLDKYESHRLKDREFDALFCTCDEGALAAVNYLTKSGRNVPGDVSVVGLNGTPWIQGTQPPLASVAWRYRQLFEVIETRLNERLQDPQMPPGFDEIPLDFIWRESAG